jgi:hypothetical protein
MLAEATNGRDDDECAEDDVALRIADFRRKRERREHRGMAVVVCVGLSMVCVGQFSPQLHSWLGPQILGLPLWAAAYGMSNLGFALAMIIPTFDYDLELGRTSLRRPNLMLLILMLWLFQDACNSENVLHMYGAPYWIRVVSEVSVLACGVPAMIRSRGREFVLAERVAPARTFLHMFTRRWTVSEYLWLQFSSDLFIKVLCDICMVLGGQYDSGVLGAAGGLVVICYTTVACACYAVWGFRTLQGTRPTPGPLPFDPKSREEFLPVMWHLAGASMGPCFGLRAYFGGYRTYPTPGLSNQTAVMLNHVNTGQLLLNFSLVIDGGEQSRGEKSQQTNYALAVVFCILFPMWLWRRKIYRTISRPCSAKQRLHDGAFIAALMADDGSASVEETQRRLIAETAGLIRRVPMRHISLSMLAASPRDLSYNADEAYALGEACGLGSIDFFVSHSWSDCPKQKFAMLMAVSLDFYLQHGREPTFWLDKCCIDQSDVERTLRCLPVLEQSCSKLLILSGDSYTQRLWCAFELYVHFAMSGLAAAGRTQVMNCRRPVQQAARLEQLKAALRAEVMACGDSDASSTEAVNALAVSTLNKEQDTAPSKPTAGANDHDNDTCRQDATVLDPVLLQGVDDSLSALTEFDVKDAHCFSADDESRLRRVIESESRESFNSAIREAGQALVTEKATALAARARSSRADPSSSFSSEGVADVANPLSGAATTVGGSSRTVVSRLEFASLDSNNYGRLNRSDLLKAFGRPLEPGDDGATVAADEGGVAVDGISARQVDELLSVIATGSEVRINGSLSIGPAEFEAWMRRAAFC